jgi:hypothetical protein
MISGPFPSVLFFRLAVVIGLLLPMAHAELPPSVYEARQKEAPEALQIDVLRVEIEPGEQANQQKVTVIAMVTEVKRTSTDLKPDQILNISYIITDRPKGYTGPGEIPLLVEGSSTVAYLGKHEEDPTYLPAAGIMSFQNF